MSALPPPDYRRATQDHLMQHIPPAFSWQSQAAQYAYRDAPGIRLERHSIGELGFMTLVDCILYRDEDGLLVGILNHYVDSNNPEEQAGNCNIWVKPSHQRRGIGTALLKDAMERWDIDFEQQRFTSQGLLFFDALCRRGDVKKLR
jgi:ribosomal protein S18 acetylase RimI-like enzyme